MGLAPRGKGARVVAEGTAQADGALPINLSGGLKAKGHPVGATGVSMHVLAAMQLSGEAGEMQRDGAGRRQLLLHFGECWLGHSASAGRSRLIAHRLRSLSA
jgi:acetyl-CoA acetyltransferase